MTPTTAPNPIHERGRNSINHLYEEAFNLINKKASDYANPSDLHSNFKYSELLQANFNEPYKSYAVMIGTKLARIAELLKQSRTPSNEPLQDSFMDIINYVGLMYERWLIEQAQTKGESLNERHPSSPDQQPIHQD